MPVAKKPLPLGALKARIARVLRVYPVTRAGIFGSYATGRNKKGSDIDILVEISDRKMSLLKFIHIKHELEKSLGKKVDLVEYDALKPLLKEKVLQEEVRIL